ncbi:MAG: class I SAM-dependent methyltransferase [Bacteroidetes bacterium]|nr:class I SAM-dependent methyltransferase [Bacteroidota bacterium]MBP7399762.1 class I SAM-dependent methyltransferase [Chitinophagales bacterium]MBK7108038.1 class I SAM-dependent methyltransferase [Bacteroidota bacterium]MBK8486531.1 class I SAM-dependent methyltransferase [Bacteroidota bacterium]MBK8683312.1 class I SAM-dependent methyltransferase [Bacteroidota bacterium]
MQQHNYSIIAKPFSQQQNGLLLTQCKNSAFANVYAAVRKAEGWDYDGAVLQSLPHVNTHDPLFNFWKSRNVSTQFLITYLREKNNQNLILDVGCGNGWLTHLLATEFADTEFYGVDIFKEELHKAANAFQLANLNWIFGDVSDNLFQPKSFNTILLCASAQYFSDFINLMSQLQNYLADDGKIIIIDTPFYSESEFIKAKERTIVYYNNLQFPEMSNHYHHRRYSDLQNLKFKLLYKPGWQNRLTHFISGKAIMQFPVIVLKK